MGLFIGTLMQSRTQAHIYHLQVTGHGSFATHVALQAYYEGIVPLIDGLVESYQGKYGILYGYQMGATLREDANYIKYFEALCTFVERIRIDLPQDSYLGNQIDTIVELINSTKNKLKFLQ
jgi:hypothetical protein